jgi:hypothetical protein
MGIFIYEFIPGKILSLDAPFDEFQVAHNEISIPLKRGNMTDYFKKMGIKSVRLFDFGQIFQGFFYFRVRQGVIFKLAIMVFVVSA